MAGSGQGMKLVLAGESAGKTSILLRLTDNTFSDIYISTIGVDFKVKKLQIDEETIKIRVWDTSGQKRFMSVALSYFSLAHGVMLVYSIADRNSFMGVDNWIEEIRKKRSNVPVVLVGNKCDLEAQREVEREEGEEKATSVGAVAFFEVSAKTDSDIEQAFKRLTTEALEHDKKTHSNR